MTSRSHFRQLAQLISVTDSCSPFLASFDSNRSVSDVSEEWSIDLCGSRNLDPKDQLALVTRDSKVVGWIGFDMLEAEKLVNDCMESITPDSLLSSDASLFDAVAAFATSSDHFFLVLQGNQFIGWLSYQELHKPLLRLCLFAMLINLERMLLEVALQHPRESIQFLPDGMKEKAQTVYLVRKYNYTDGGEPYDSKLLECTTMIDRSLLLGVRQVSCNR